MQQIVKDYEIIADVNGGQNIPMGDSASPKMLIFHILDDNSVPVDVLDIGFGVGTLGELLKINEVTQHWNIDGVDGWKANCQNGVLFSKHIYRNVWHGLAQELPSDQLSKYKILCLLDVIEHLDAETAKWTMRTLLTAMHEDSYLFVSTPLWFYPQSMQQNDDLEEHLIGIPITTMLALRPIAYAINEPLIGGFVYKKESLKYIDLFHPSSNKNFSLQMGLNILKAANIEYKTGVFYKVNY